MKMQNIESRCYKTGKDTFCSHVRAFFRPEILGCGSERVKEREREKLLTFCVF